MIPGASWCSNDAMYDSFFRKMVGAHKNDERILLWDICNEPYSFGGNAEYEAFMEPYETKWLKKMCDMCREVGASQPCGISHYAGPADLGSVEKTVSFTDVMLIHPYYFYSDEDAKNLPQEGGDKLLDLANELSARYNKPVFTTETCWGSRDDKVRSEIVKRTLAAHKKAEIGFVAHALHWSHVADLHDDDEGPLSFPGNLMFIDRNDEMRKHHEVFNELTV